jgi:hypothetical protein
MGLFSSVLHLRDVDCERLLPALDSVLHDAGFARRSIVAVAAGGPHTMSDHDAAIAAGPCYVASPLNGRWLTLIETHRTLPNAPSLSELRKRLSDALASYALTLVVQDDDVFLYELACKGQSLDAYNSCPQYFEQERLSEAQVRQLRHLPEPFVALMPPGRTLDEVRSMLSRGWWQAHDMGQLGPSGLPLHRADEFAVEAERMAAFGTLMQLHGATGTYPYAAWADSREIEWSSFSAIRYLPV